MANKFLIKRGDESPNDSTIDNYELVYNYTDNELWTKHNGSVVKISSGTNGTVTNVVAGNGLTGGGQTTATLALDFSQLTDMTGNISGTTEFILQNGTVESRKAASEIKLTAFDATGFSISGAVDTSGTPIAQEYARFTDANTVEGRSAAGVRTDLGLVVGTNVQAQDDLLQNIADFPTSSSSNDGKVVTYQDSNGSLVLSTPSVGTITSVTGMTDNNVLTASGSTTISGESAFTFNASTGLLKLNQDNSSTAFKVTGGGGGSKIAQFIRDVGVASPYAEAYIHAGGADPQLTFRSSANQYFSMGIDLSANSFKISEHTGVGTNDRLTIDTSGNIAMGTVTAGTWNGTAIAVANGGTGATSASAARANLGLSTGTTSSFLTGDPSMSTSGYIMLRGIVNQSETGSSPAAITFGNSATYGNDNISLITAGAKRIFINSSGVVDIPGSLTLGTALAIAEGGTGATSASAARTNLQLGDLAIEDNIPASRVISGTLADARIPNLATSKITSGTFADARIPSLATSKITSGTFSSARMPATFGADAVTQDDITNRTESGFYQTASGTTGEGWPITNNSYQHMIATTHSNDSNYYSMQIAGSFYDQNFYGRKTNSSGTTSWKRFLTTSDEGSGNGLDADTLDGQQGSYYAQASKSNNKDYYSTVDAAGSYLGGHYSSGGTEKPSDGTFGAGKFKVAMLAGSNLGFGGTWNDVMWVSAYNGGDVKSSHALVFDKYSTNVYVSDQNYDSASWGTGYKLWHNGNDGSGTGLDADLLDGNHASAFLTTSGTAANSTLLNNLGSGSFLRSDANDTASGQYNFTKVNDHAIKVGTVRGTVVGSQSGEYIQLYERVAIGSPSGWGSRNAPTYGLSVYGGTLLATDTGNVGIGLSHTTTPVEKLSVAGNIRLENQGNGIGIAYTNTSLGGFIPHPGGGQYRNNSGNITGAIEIKVPAVYADMVSFWVDIFDYSVNESMSFQISGYVYQGAGSNEWVNETATQISNNTNFQRTVRFGHDGTNHIVYIGELSDIWSYPQITVRDVTLGYSSSIDHWIDGWSIDFEASAFGNVDATITDTLVQAGKIKMADGAGKFIHNTTSSRDKIRVWNSSHYAIGMEHSNNYGGLASQYAMTFSMDDTSNRGFLWVKDSHTKLQGAMALTTDGKLTVAHSMRLGYGESDTTTPGSTYALDVSGAANITGNLTVANNKNFQCEDAQGNLANLIKLDTGNSIRLGDATHVDQIAISTSSTTNAMIFQNNGAIALNGNVTMSSPATINYGLVVNEGGHNYDTRIESVGNPNMFRLDADTNRIGIGIVSPQKTLHVFQGEGGIGAKHATIRLGGYSTVGPDIAAYRHTGNSNDQGLIFSTYHNSNGTTDTMTLDSLGNVGIGEVAPASKLQVQYTTTSNGSAAIAEFGESGTGAIANSGHQVIIGGPNVSGYTGAMIYSDSTSGVGIISFADGRGANDSWRGMIQYEHSNDAMTFSTNTSERMRINSSGAVTIGGHCTLSSGKSFRVHNESSYDKYRLYGTSGAYSIGMISSTGFGAVDSWAMTFTFSTETNRGFLWRTTGHSSGQGAMSLNTEGKLNVAHSVRVGYGISDGTAPGATYGLDVSGSIGATADVVAYISSDKRLKNNIKNIANPLEKLNKLNGVEFDWNDKQDLYKGHDIGVIAQEVEEVLPEIVDTREDGHKAVKYDRMVALLIEAVKEQQVQIDELKTKLGE